MSRLSHPQIRPKGQYICHSLHQLSLILDMNEDVYKTDFTVCFVVSNVNVKNYLKIGVTEN